LAGIITHGYAQQSQREKVMSEVLSTIDSLNAYRAKARAWLAENAPAFAGDVRRGLSFDEDVALGRKWQQRKAENGYAAITLPAEYGGGGGSELEKIAFLEEEMHYQVPTAYFTISLSNPLPIFLRYASEEWKQRLAPSAIRGEHIWCQLFSEPSAGSDLAALRLKATRDGDDWILNGQKLWTSWAQIADWGVIVTRTDPTLPKHAGLTYFFLNMRTSGIEVRPVKKLTGESDVNEVFFDNVRVPDAQRMGNVGDGFKVAIETLMIERYAVSDEAAGGPELESLIDLAEVAELQGESIFAQSDFRAALVKAYYQRLGLRSIHSRAMDAIAKGREPGPEGAIRKLLLGEMRQHLGAVAMDLQGADSLELNEADSANNNFTWSWLDAPGVRIAGGTDEILRNTIAERVLGLPQDHRPDKGIPFNQS
jgi:alkylation response protein AidB-like acyl-CoA dehydrogenase